MDPVSAIANAVAGIAGVIGLSSRRANRPDRLSPADFQEEWSTSDILLIGMFAVLLVVIVAIVIKGHKK